MLLLDSVPLESRLLLGVSCEAEGRGALAESSPPPSPPPPPPAPPRASVGLAEGGRGVEEEPVGVLACL